MMFPAPLLALSVDDPEKGTLTAAAMPRQEGRARNGFTVPAHAVCLHVSQREVLKVAWDGIWSGDVFNVP